MSEAVTTFEHARLGPIEVSPDEVLHFPGLPGFPRAQRFVVRGHDQESTLAWLVSLDDAQLAFVITSPFELVPDYAPDLRPHHLRAVDHQAGDELRIVSIASIAGGELALNLAAPVLINMRNRRAVQALLEDDRYPSRRSVVRQSTRS